MELRLTQLAAEAALGGLLSLIGSKMFWEAAKRPETTLDLEAGLAAHVELLLKAVLSERSDGRARQISEQIAELAREEALYWSAKLSRPQAIRALKTLLLDPT